MCDVSSNQEFSWSDRATKISNKERTRNFLGQKVALKRVEPVIKYLRINVTKP
jgi:hypothetical protein